MVMFETNAMFAVPSMLQSGPTSTIPALSAVGLNALTAHATVAATIYVPWVSLVEGRRDMVESVGTGKTRQDCLALNTAMVPLRELSNFGSLTIEEYDEGLPQPDGLGPEQVRCKWQHDPPS